MLRLGDHDTRNRLVPPFHEHVADEGDVDGPARDENDGRYILSEDGGVAEGPEVVHVVGGLVALDNAADALFLSFVLEGGVGGEEVQERVGVVVEVTPPANTQCEQRPHKSRNKGGSSVNKGLAFLIGAFDLRV